jgi:hypothetical protein
MSKGSDEAGDRARRLVWQPFLISRFLGTFHHLVTLIPLAWAAAGSNRNRALYDYVIHLRLLFQTKSHDIAYW